MLEGKELEKKIGDVGSYSVDVDSSLNVKVEVLIATIQGGVKISSANAVEVPLMEIIEKACLKNSITWDESAIAGFKALLKIA